MGARLVMLRVPHTTPDWWQEGNQTEEGPGVGGGFLYHHGNNITERNPLPPPRKKDGGVALRFIIHGERIGAWVPGMEGFHIPSIRHRTLIPVPPLQ